MQLELDFSLLPTAEEAVGALPKHRLPEFDLGRFARERMAYGSARERQGVVHRFALPALELKQVAAELRWKAATRDPVAINELVALLSGVPPEHVGKIGLHGACASAATVVSMDLRTGHLHTDMGRICLGQAASPAANGTALPASHALLKPLPRLLVTLLAETVASSPQAQSLGQLLPCVPPLASQPIGGSTEGRLRATHARMRDGLSAFAIALGLDNYDAALVTNDFALIDKARLFYVRSQPSRIVEGCRTLYAALGWGEPVPGEILLPFGSKAVPSDNAVRAVFAHLRRHAENSLPGRRYTLEALLRHHNDYALLVAWTLAFCIGARETTAFDFNARTCQPNASFVPYRDKASGPFKQIRPVLMCRVARDCVAAWWQHIRALELRANRVGAASNLPWMRHLGAVMQRDRVPLLFLIANGDAVPVGSAHLARAVPPELQLVPNAGRHFWQTVLHEEGITTHAIDVFARHACRGVEPMSSTTLASALAVHEQVCTVQDAVLRRLGISALTGLGRRVAS